MDRIDEPNSPPETEVVNEEYSHPDESSPLDESTQFDDNTSDENIDESESREEFEQDTKIKRKKFSKKCSVMLTGIKKVDLCDALLPILYATAIKKDGKPKEVRILLDTASTASFIKVGTNRLLKHEIIEPDLSLTVSHLDGNNSVKPSKLIKFSLLMPNKEILEINAFTVTNILNLPKVKISTDVKNQLTEQFENRLNIVENGKDVEILLGTGDALRLIENVIKVNNFFVIQTPWGFTPCGSNLSASNDTACLTTYMEELNKTLEKMWRIEEMTSDNVKGLTRDENIAVDKIEEGLKFNQEKGRFETALLFREKPNLKNNYDRALARFHSLQNSLKKNSELNEVYTKAINDFIENNVVELVQDENYKEGGRDDLYYLPHRAVYDPERISTKCRVVFDASAKTATGYSLNSFLLSGPPLQLDIANLAMKFRTRKIVLIGDIAKMFLNIDVNENDRDYLRFLWKETHESGPPRVYRFSTLIFGATDSPFQAITCLQKLVSKQLLEKELSEIDKRVCDVILHDTYVDDISTGGNTVEETLALMQGIQKLLNTAHFFVKKWKTNSPELLAQIPEADRAPIKETFNAEILVDEQDGSRIISENSKMLGLSWEPEKDFIYFQHENFEELNNDTKTSVASLLAKIYDPLGLVSPFVLQARQIMKKTHQLKLPWKANLPAEILPEWHEWIQQVKNLNSLQFNRYIELGENSELHVFSDASGTGYGAAAYIRNKLGEKYTCQLLMARSKIAPIKEQTIPRLELLAALLAAKLANDISKELKIPKHNVHCWSDSEIVLFWLQKKPDALIPFVANRIEKIQLYALPFMYINTSENPADIASRGCIPSELSKALWNRGPDFLLRPEHKWPAQKFDLSQVDARLGVKKQKVFNFSNVAMKVSFDTCDERMLLSKDVSWDKYYSSYNKLIKRTAHLYKMSDKWRSKTKFPVEIKDEMFYEIKALQFWIKEAQNSHFEKELKALRRNKKIPKKSSLGALDPQLDDNGILRVGGRLSYANLSETIKHPIIMPKSHPFTSLLVKNAHEANMHMGTDWVHHYLRQTYWILSSRQLIRVVLRKCVTCAKVQGPRAQQQMAQLPYSRVRPHPPFAHVGVDYTGKITIKSAKKGEVSYIVVFSCLTTRAIHLELVENGTTEQFIAALKRMMGSKGTPTDIYSDHALVFQKAKGILEKRELQQDASYPVVKWHFSTEMAPHTGGVWERMVQLVKRPLKKMIGRKKLSFSELFTVCKELEGLINDRPLAQVSSDSLEVITPSLLLLGRKIKTCTDINASQEVNPIISAQTQMGQRKELVTKLWDAWSKEYCLQLQERSKWQSKTPNISVGDLVLVEKDLIPRTLWPLAKVTQVHPNHDGSVRKVTLLLPESEGRIRYITRSIHNIFPLEMTRDEIEE